MARATLLAAVAACALSGCGTMMNVGPGGADTPKVYGGVVSDLDLLEHERPDLRVIRMRPALIFKAQAATERFRLR